MKTIFWGRGSPASLNWNSVPAAVYGDGARVNTWSDKGVGVTAFWLWTLGTERAGELSVGLRNLSDGTSLLLERGSAVEAKGILFSRDSETLELDSLLWGQVTKHKPPGV